MSEPFIPAESTPPRPPQPYYEYPGRRPAPQRGSNCGCWLAGLTTAFVVTLLVVAGLFLPPFNLGDQLFGTEYAMLNSQNNAVAAGGLTLIVDPNDAGDEFGVALATTAIDSFVANDRGAGEWIPAANTALYSYLAPQSRIYTIDTTGTVPETVTFTIALENITASPDLLDVYSWDQGDYNWQFVPSRLTSDGQILVQMDHIPEHLAVFEAEKIAPIVLTTLESGQPVPTNISTLATILAPTGMQPAMPTSANRTLVGNPAPGFETGSSYRVMPLIRNYADPRAVDPTTVVELISNTQLRAEHINELVAFASAGRYNGLFIDYRDLPEDQRDHFTAFVRELRASLQIANLSLGVVVPAAQNIDGTWQTGAYNWRELGQSVDYLQINFGLDPTTFTPGADRLVEAMLRWGVGEVSRYKILGALTAQSLREVDGGYVTIGYNEALSPMGDVVIDVPEISETDTVAQGNEIRIGLDGAETVPGVDETIQAPYVDYLAADGSVLSRMWLTTNSALRFRMERFDVFGLGGVALPDLLSEGVSDGVYAAVTDYKLEVPADPVQPELVLNWRVEGAEGQVSEFTSGFNEEIIITLEAPDGNYAVNVEVSGGEVSSNRGGAAVALFAPTITPTPLPTSTPTPRPTATPTLVPIIPTDTPPPIPQGESRQAAAPAAPPAPPPAGPNPNIPAAGSIGALEIGGHVQDPNNGAAHNAMRNAGMTWMKVQIPWGIGGGTETAQAAINAARGAGFKILLGVVGDPGQVESTGGAYVERYASFVGRVAELGPDAIEIWNEPNLSREWPEGQISGANYTALLSAAYQRIKAVNPGILVISAAPAPTGAENAFPGQVVNDDNFLRQMVDAGALNVMDCLGLHYNEGTVSPRQTSGDFRDNYYTRYLPTLLDTYWNITNGQRPICITELGYLTPEGLGALPDFFSWASNVTVGQQAAWLAEAAAVSSQSGRVRLMIVWNVDFTNYGADPMAGYAILRPDGTCPACDALARAK